MFQRLAMAVLVMALTGCATVMNESMQPIRVDTRTESGETVADAECRLSNEYEAVTVHSGNTAQVRRSNTDLEIVCRHPGNPDAQARAISRANAGMFGNIIIGGGIGAIIDHSKGTAYTYPTWVQLVFGKTLVFDRRHEQDGQPVAATDGAATPPAAAAPGTAPSASSPNAAPRPAAPTPPTQRPADRPVTLDDLNGLLPAQR